MIRKIIGPAALFGVVLLVISGTQANAKPAPQPTKPPVTLASHSSTLGGEISDGITPGSVTGELSLIVDQTGVSSPIVLANFNLSTGNTWNSADVTVLSREDGASGTPVSVSAALSGASLTVSGLSLSDSDGDGAVEFTLTASNADISTSITTSGSYGVSSQFRTNSTRKIKSQAWVISTSSAITLTDPAPAICEEYPTNEAAPVLSYNAGTGNLEVTAGTWTVFPNCTNTYLYDWSYSLDGSSWNDYALDGGTTQNLSTLQTTYPLAVSVRVTVTATNEWDFTSQDSNTYTLTPVGP